MKQVLRLAVVVVAALVALQPLLADGFCAADSCSGVRCATKCCDSMRALTRPQASAACHGAHAAIPQNSTPNQHRCDVQAVRSSLQLLVPGKAKIAHGSQPSWAFQSVLFATGDRFAPPPAKIIQAKRSRHLLLEVFRI